MKRFLLFFVLPVLALLALAVFPLMRGSETLFLRDVFNAHLPMKWAQAEAMREGFFPLLDPYRAGGQPLAGNLNAAPFYPDNLLYLAGGTIWALNAHFWLHWLLSPFAFFWMARAWGLRREAAWAGGAIWATGGFFLSHLCFYNLIAGATLAPAFVAACLRLATPDRPRWILPAAAGLWALLLLGGDPLMAVLALGLGLAAALTRRERVQTVKLGTAALALGTLVALPQIVEFVRILSLSFRGFWGYTAQAATIASWDPRQALEWLIPFAYGRPDLTELGSFWGSRFFTGFPPYYFSLYPGLLALVLIAVAGRPRSAAGLWAWGGVAVGIFFALGRFNPLASWLLSLAGGGALRYPVKFWLPVALGTALLAGIGFERLLAGEGDNRWRLALLSLGAVLGFGWLLLAFGAGSAEPWLRRIIPPGFSDAFVANERLRWAGLCLFSALLVAAFALAGRLRQRRPELAAGLLLAVHTAAQLWFLQPLRPTDAVLPYRLPSPALVHVPPESRVVSGSFSRLFGSSNLAQGLFPRPTIHWVERRAFFELYPAAGELHRRRYELNVSPEGLDSFLTRAAQGAVKGGDDADRVKLLAAWGVDRLLLDRPLETQAGVKTLAQLPSFGQTLWVYQILAPAPELHLARRVFPAPHLQAAVRRMVEPDFQPGSDVVVAGEGAPRTHPEGRVRLLRSGPESLTAEVDSPQGTYLVIQRAHLPLWKAAVDGQPVEIDYANLHRMGFAVPAGKHRVRLWVDRGPLAVSSVLSVIGLLGIAVLTSSRIFREEG